MSVTLAIMSSIPYRFASA